VVILAAVVVLILASGRRRDNTGIVNGRGSYIVNLNENGRDVHFIQFPAGRQVTITVTSDFNTDVDLHVFDGRGLMIAFDNRPDKDCFVSFRAQRTEQYRVEVVNLGPGANRSVVHCN
jgi:hypothetical protein